MLQLSLQQVLTRLVALLVITALHGFLVALLARALGDKGPQYDGRLTLNPFQHLDFIAIPAACLFQVGWIKPMEIDSKALRGGWLGALGLVLVALAGTLAVGFLLFMAQGLVLTLIPQQTFAATAVSMLITIYDLTVWFVLVNLIPIPPLAGGIVLRALLPGVADRLQRYELVVRLALLAIFATGVVQAALQPLHDLFVRY
jgi:Zn-dependent protease